MVADSAGRGPLKCNRPMRYGVTQGLRILGDAFANNRGDKCRSVKDAAVAKSAEQGQPARAIYAAGLRGMRSHYEQRLASDDFREESAERGRPSNGVLFRT
jgi:hypothetical protein